jgi:hypothetical protein
VEELHADGLSCKDVDEAVGGDTILSDEPFKDMETLWCNLEYCSVFESGVGFVGSILDETSIHEVLGNLLGHLTSHGERSSSSCRDDAIRIPWIGTTVGLGEFERGKIRRSLIPTEP